MQLLENLQITAFPHMEEKARKEFMSSIRKRIVKSAPKKSLPTKSADDQYEELRKRMNLGKAFGQ